MCQVPRPTLEVDDNLHLCKAPASARPAPTPELSPANSGIDIIEHWTDVSRSPSAVAVLTLLYMGLLCTF